MLIQHIEVPRILTLKFDFPIDSKIIKFIHILQKPKIIVQMRRIFILLQCLA